MKTKWVKVLRIGFSSNEKDAQPFRDIVLCTLQATRMLCVRGEKSGVEGFASNKEDMQPLENAALPCVVTKSA